MGTCTSREATAVGAAASTTKLVLAGGELREFDRPIKASLVVEKGSDCFVCDADEMDLDGFLTSVSPDDELKLGQIYFVLPRSMLKRRICGDDLAALAVKASAALVNGRTGVTPLVPTERVRAATEGRGGRGRNFATDLSVIME